MITENVLLFLVTLFAILSVILIWKKVNKKGWPDPFPPQPEPTIEPIQKAKDRLHRMYMGMLDFGVLHYTLMFLTSWIITDSYLRYLGGDSVVTFRISALYAMVVTAMIYAFIYGMKTSDVDSIRWDTVRSGWPWYEEKYTPIWLVRKQKEEEEKEEDEKNQRRE